MLSRGAIGNLINRYRAVLKKCRLMNTFGSLAAASMLVLGSTGMAKAVDIATPMTLIKGNSPLENVVLVPGSADSAGQSFIIVKNNQITLNGGLDVPGNTQASISEVSIGEVDAAGTAVTTYTFDGANFTGGLFEDDNNDYGARPVVNIQAGYDTHKVIIQNSSFSDIHTNATNEVTPGTSGGIIGSGSGADIELKNVAFSGNSLDNPYQVQGGVLQMNCGHLTADSISVANTQVSSGHTLGGAACLFNTEGFTIANSEFSRNRVDTTGSAEGGALYATYRSKWNYSQAFDYAVIKNTSFTDNSIASSVVSDRDYDVGGGAVSLYSGAVQKEGSTIKMDASLTDVSFSGNSVTASGTNAYGGALGMRKTLDSESDPWPSATLENVTFTNNAASYTGSEEGKSAMGGAIYNNAVLNLKGENTFTGNSSTHTGGAIHNDGIINFDGLNTFSGNSAKEGRDIYNAGTINVIGGITTLGEYDDAYAGTSTSELNIDKATLVANARNFVTVNENGTFTDTYDVTVTNSGSLNLRWWESTYTYADYEAVSKALFGEGEAGILNILNASLAKLEDGSKIVAGGDVSSDGAFEFSTTPTIVEGSEPAAASNKRLPSVPTEVVTLVKADDPSHTPVSPSSVTMNGSILAMKSMGVANGTLPGVEMTVTGGSNVTFTGDPMVDQNGTAVPVDANVNGGSTLNLGMPGYEPETPADILLGDMTIGGGGQVNVYNSSVQSGKLLLNSGGTLFLDPSYKSFTTLGSPLAGNAIIGSGSVLTIGQIADLEAHVKEAGFSTSALGGGFVVSPANAVLALGEGIELAHTGGILVDATADSATSVTPNTVTFAEGSLFIVNAATVSTPSGAIKANGNGTLTVAGDAKLAIVDIKANREYTIASGFGTQNVQGWSDVSVNALTYAQIARSGDAVILTTASRDAAEVFPGIIPVSGMNEMIASGVNAVDSPHAGIRFLSRSIEPQYISPSHTVDLVNEVSRASVTAGVQNTSLRTADVASNTVLDHMSLSRHDASSAIHSNGVDFWAAPLYGNLYTSGMVASNSSVRSQFGGLALGADFEACQFLGGKFRLGAAINGGGGQSETRGAVTSTQNDYGFGGLNIYAGWNSDALNIIASFGYGFGDHDLDMSLPHSMRMKNAKADIDTSVFTADLRAEYQLKTALLDLLPHAGLRYTALKTDSYELKSGGTHINHVKSDTQNIVQFPVGLTISRDFDCCGWSVKPLADISVIPAAGEKKAFTKVRFSGLNAWDSANSRIMDSTSWSGTVGIQAEKGNMTFGLNYGLLASSNETDQSVQVKFGWKF
ncbi:MAG: autotransporter domain-containing protein [Mailhella sp.]|nr:autotransporter domain-containing protein [Mailhella sp.]